MLGIEARTQPRLEPGVETTVSQVPSKSSGSSRRPSIRAAISEVRGRRCPETRPSTRWPFGAYPYRRAVGVVYHGERTVPAGVGTLAEDHVLGSPSFFFMGRETFCLCPIGMGFHMRLVPRTARAFELAMWYDQCRILSHCPRRQLVQCSNCFQLILECSPSTMRCIIRELLASSGLKFW